MLGIYNLINSTKITCDSSTLSLSLGAVISSGVSIITVTSSGFLGFLPFLLFIGEIGCTACSTTGVLREDEKIIVCNFIYNHKKISAKVSQEYGNSKMNRIVLGESKVSLHFILFVFFLF